MPSPIADLDQPRQRAVAAMRASIAQDLWQQNAAFVESLRQLIAAHPVAKHHAIDALSSGSFDVAALRTVHLEYRHAIVQIFTDALLAAQLQTRQLEPRLRPGSKLAPRFLITLNDLDEFGFRPGCDADGNYRGDPARAHYPLFERVLDDYGISQQQRQAYLPSPISRKVREFLEHSYGNYLDVVVLLAAAEAEAVLFSAPLREATRALGICVDEGYYVAHDARAGATADDDHENDLWLALTQALTPEHYLRVQQLCMRYCDLWDQFWTAQLALTRPAASLANAQGLAEAV